METLDFLQRVVTTPEGWFVLATYNGVWKEQWYEWPKDSESIANMAATVECDCYFSSYLFNDKRSLKANALPSKTIQADLDNANVLTLELNPTILVQTSRARHQGYWLLEEALATEAHEQISKRITYAIPDCDRSGWAVGRKVRLPNTNNCKYGDKQKVSVVRTSNRIYTRGELELGFEVNVNLNSETIDSGEDFVNYPEQEFEIGPQEFLENVRDNLPPKVVAQYNVVAEDRSAALWALECSLFRAGLSRYEVYFLAKNCANNKFATLRINSKRELAKDVLRAEQAGVSDPKSAVLAIRQMKLGAVEKSHAILDTCITIMKTTGNFARGRDTVGWYVHQGHPIPIVPKSSELTAFLENTLGLNYTEKEQRYVVSGLLSYTHQLPATSLTGALSHYDITTNSLFLHTGRKQVLQINERGISHTLNGSPIIFPWHTSFEPFVPLESSINWAESLFGDSLQDVVGLTPDQALALLRVWFLFILFRSLAEARPILAVFGQPGSGKSAMLRRAFAVFYGSEKKIGGITKPDNFDTQTSNFPFVVFDNIDTWEGWLPDRLAQVINNTDIDRRKLYTDNEIYSVKRQAMVALTAHDPKFGRADVVDRLLILSLSRVPEFKDEASMYREVLARRNYIWGAIIGDILMIVKTPRFIDNSLQFRIQDFATIGLWISRALNIELQFRSAINAIKHEQKAFILEDEAMLVDALHRACARARVTGRWSSASELWGELELISQDPVGFQKKYRNTTILARKLHTLQDSLNTVFEVKWQDENDRRLWFIGENK